MGISFWRSIVFFSCIIILGFLLFPSHREMGLLFVRSDSPLEAINYLEKQYRNNPYDIANTKRYMESLLYQGNDRLFLKISKDILGVYPNNPQILQAMAQFYEYRLNLKEASKYWVKMLETDPKLEDIKYQLISYYLISKDTDSLMKFYENEIKNNRASLDEYYELARLYSLKKELADTLALYERINLKFPKEKKAKEYLAQIYEYEGKIDSAISLYKEISDDFPEDKDAALKLADMLLRYNRNEEALNTLKVFVERFKEDDKFLVLLVDIYMRLGKNNEALKLAEEVYKREPENYILLKSLGELYFGNNQFDKSAWALRLYNEKTGGDFRSYHILGDVLTAQGKIQAGNRQYIHALELIEKQHAATLAEKTEKVWLLWKLGRKAYAQKMIFSLLSDYPDNTDIIELAAVINLDAGRIQQAKVLLRRLKALGGNTIRLKELNARVLSQEGSWQDALFIYESLIKEFPQRKDYRRDFAEIISKQKRWPEAKSAYFDLISEYPEDDTIIWDYRQAKKEGSRATDNNFEYVLAPESLRQYYMGQSITGWVNEKLRLNAEITNEIHSKKALGDTPPVHKTMPGYSVGADFFLNDLISLSGLWKVVYRDLSDYNELRGRVQFEQPSFRSLNELSYNRLVRDPIEGLEKKARIDKFSTVNEALLFNFLTLGQMFEIDYFRLPGDENTINGKQNLGYKLINDVYLGFPFFNKPYFAFNFHFHPAHWHKSFENAEQIIDFIGDEKIYYGGLYFEDRISDKLQFTVSFTRSYDSKRKFYSSLSNCSMNIWPRENIEINLSWEFDYNVQGVIGAGNVQIIKSKIKYIF